MGKLIRYEFKNLSKKILIADFIMVFIVLLSGIAKKTPIPDGVQQWISLFTVVSVILLSITIPIAVIYSIMRRFYDDVYDVYCYLGAMSPLKAHQIVISKMLSGFAIGLISVIGIVIATKFILLHETTDGKFIFDNAGISFWIQLYDAEKMQTAISNTKIFPFMVMVLISAIYQVMFFLWSVSVGQTATVHKVLTMIFTLILGSLMFSTITTVVHNIFLQIPAISGAEIVDAIHNKTLTGEYLLLNYPTKLRFVMAIYYFVWALILFFAVNSSVKKRISKYDKLNEKYGNKLWNTPFDEVQ